MEPTQISRAPDFDLSDLSGNRRSLFKLTQQGPVLVAFFKVSCPTCQYTLPYLQRLTESGSVRVIGISQDEASVTSRFGETYGLTFPILLDAASAKYPVSNAYRIATVPSLFLIEPDGSIAKFSKGFVRQDLEEIGNRFGFLPFRLEEQVPEFRPG